VKCTDQEGCPLGTYCDAASCVPGCKEDKHCLPGGEVDGGSDAGDAGDDDAGEGAAGAAGAAADAGSNDASADAGDATLPEGGGVVCDTTTNKCVGCVGDQDCPPGTLCDTASSVCIFGCSPTKACPTGLTCCGSTCADLQTSVDHCGACDALCAPPGAQGISKPACAKPAAERATAIATAIRQRL
jgi:hypothetical protein